ncbi:MAG TPA: molecular chaperone HtpG, partial [Flavobacteriales bacterium]|nr:molecular chaperone HtpG [Flavobacteriales bacterium]
MAQQGTINVTTDNIFPIIKQFLYSDQEIFLRELVSNAVDATQKRKMLAQLGEISEITGTPQVEVLLDEEAGTMTIRDAGIGMTAEEIDKYINQIAFSGATDFLEKYKDADAKQAIIGHFGLGFYSAFMVADRVDIVTLSQREGSQAVKWSCDGSPNFSLEDVDKAQAGTDIVLHVSEDAKEYLAQERIREILNTYCKFMPVEIVQGTKSEYVDDPEGAKDDEGNVKKVSIDVP